MSYATTAPGKFDLQDHVCVEIMLRASDHYHARLLIEPPSGEDAELEFTVNGERAIIEIQVKGAVTDVAIDLIGACLANFPSGKSDDTVLERLIREPERRFAIVVTGRCNDAVAAFVAPPNWLVEPRASTPQATQKAIRAAFAAAVITGGADKALHRQRVAHLAEAAASIKAHDLARALKRVVVIERATPTELEERCAKHYRKIGIPNDRHEALTTQLKKMVDDARGKVSDAFPSMRTALAHARPFSVRPVRYVKRGDENDWVNIVRTDNRLVLSGISRAGKSDAATWVAAEFETEGFDVRVFANLGEAERFLRDPVKALRLAVLDDPLGGVHKVENPARNLTALEKIVRQSSPDRRVIVAQGQETLLDVAGAQQLAGILTGGARWIDLSNPRADFLANMWRAEAAVTCVPTDLGDFIETSLANGLIALEPGCLVHFADVHDRVARPFNLDQIVRLAREDARAFGRELKDDACSSTLLTALAIGSSEHDGVGTQEIAFIEGGGGATLPTLRLTIDQLLQIGTAPTPQLPSYDSAPNLASTSEKDLNKLERRRIIRFNAAKETLFIHPFYRAAAESTLRGITTLELDQLLNMHRRALFCRSASASRSAASNLDWVRETVSQAGADADKVVGLAIEGLNSLFVATRDICYQLLVKLLPVLPAKQACDVSAKVRSVTFIDLDTVRWVNGVAMLDANVLASDAFDGAFGETPQHSEIVETLMMIEGNAGDLPSAERAAELLRYLRRHSPEMTARHASRLLSYDEAVLRYEAARTWLATPRANDADVLERISADAHPLVARGAYKGALASWHDSTEDRRKTLIATLLRMAELPATAITLLETMVLFDRYEHTAGNPPWALFEALMPQVMQALPANPPIIEARLYSVVNTAAKKLSTASIALICHEWLGWIRRSLADGEFLSDYGLGVLGILLPATRGHPELRAGAVRDILSVRQTEPLLTVFADLVDLWDDLTGEERDLLLVKLREDAPDRNWRHALALTRRKVPEVIERALMPDGVRLADDASQLLAKMPEALRVACLAIHCGYPGRVSQWRGKRSPDGPWQRVAGRIASDINDPSFAAVLDQAVFHMDDEAVALILGLAGSTDPDRLFHMLLDHKIRWVGNWLQRSWKAMLDLAPNDEMRDGWLTFMAAAAPKIIERLGDIRLWMNDRDYMHALSEKLKNDVTPLVLIKRWEDLPEDLRSAENNKQLLGVLQMTIREAPPSILQTAEMVGGGLRRLGQLTTEIENDLQLLRDDILARSTAIWAAAREPERSIHGWVME